MVLAVGGGWLVLRATGSLSDMFAVLAAAMVIYGTLVAWSIARGAWFESILSK